MDQATSRKGKKPSAPAAKTVKKKPAAAAAKTTSPLPVEAPAPAELAVAAPSAPVESVTKQTLHQFNPVLCIVGQSSARLFGLAGDERLRRQFSRAGLVEEITPDAIAAHRGPVIIARADAVLDQPLVQALLKRPNLVLTTEDKDGRQPVAGNLRADDAMAFAKAVADGEALKSPILLQRAPSEIDANFWKALRKRETPYAFVVTPQNEAAVDWRMFMGTYKGATDLVTKHVWPVPAYHAVRWLAPRGITPNMVTSVAAVMTVAAFVLFLYGQFAYGLLAGWAMTFLDTVDGKLARTTLTSSKWGDVFDHGIDLVHPPFWYFAWAIGLSAWGINWSASTFWWTTGIILGGYVVQRLMEGISIKWLGLEIHIWRRIDTFFRQITARRNPNLILLSLSLLVSRPDWGLIAVAAWTLICLVLHGLQLLQAFAAKRATGPLESWMTKPGTTNP